MATAKQRAWRKKFASMYGGKKRRQGSQISHRRSYSMRRKSSRGHRRSGIRGSIGSAKGIFNKVALGVGGASVAALLVNQFAPQFSPIARIGGAYFAGGITGVVADTVISGGLGNILGAFGGGSSNGGGDAI